MNYKLTALAATLLLSVSSFSHAEFIGPGKTSQLSTVASVKQLSDDSGVFLEGYLVREIKHEHYIFQDDTGEIEVEIDTEDFNGLKITPQTKIHLIGEVDKGFFTTTLDADSITLAK